MAIDLAKLNSATKYPSIETYHELGLGGVLQESGNPFAGWDGPIHVSEKIDGANARIICIEDDWYIGSREELLTAKGDRVPNPALGIVDTLKDVAPLFTGTYWYVDVAYVFFVEVYGDRRMPAWKTYGDGTRADFRLFDVATVDLDILGLDIEQIAAQRDRGGLQFLERSEWRPVYNVEPVLTETYLLSGEEAPATVDGMHAFLKGFAQWTHAPIGNVEIADRGRPEGLVFRTKDRSIIRKARYQSYERTAKLRQSQ